jgi:hypothetical protein
VSQRGGHGTLGEKWYESMTCLDCGGPGVELVWYKHASKWGMVQFSLALCDNCKALRLLAGEDLNDDV